MMCGQKKWGHVYYSTPSSLTWDLRCIKPNRLCGGVKQHPEGKIWGGIRHTKQTHRIQNTHACKHTFCAGIWFLQDATKQGRLCIDWKWGWCTLYDWKMILQISGILQGVLDHVSCWATGDLLSLGWTLDWYLACHVGSQSGSVSIGAYGWCHVCACSFAL